MKIDMKTKLYILAIFAAVALVSCDLNQMPGGSTITEDQYNEMDDVAAGTVKVATMMYLVNVVLIWLLTLVVVISQ